MIIKDNFMTKYEFERIQQFIMSDAMTWHISPGITKRGDSEQILMTHLFYANDQPEDAEGLNLLLPLMQLVDIKSLIRIKANAYPKNDTLQVHPPHTDSDYPCKTALFYINSNDGYTQFSDGTKVESVANRWVEFDSTKPHCSTNCTNTKFRYNLNFNYF